MAHVRLILAIEERFGFQFSNRKLGKMTNIGRMIDLIANKISNDGILTALAALFQEIALPNFGWGNCNALSARARKCR